MKFNLKNLLTNKIVLYVMFFLALTTVFGYFMANNCSAVLFFILLALLTNYFNKNMIVILGCAIVGTHLLAVLNMFGTRREGFKEGANIGRDDGDGDKEHRDGDKEQRDKEHRDKKHRDRDGDWDGDMAEKDKGNKKRSRTRLLNDDYDGNKDDAEAKKKGALKELKKQEKKHEDKSSVAFANINQKLSPEEILPSKEQLLSKGDKAKAKEKAYDLLESTIGKDNLKGIASDTQVLLKKQTELMDELKNVTPLLSQAMGMVNNLDLNNLTGMFDKLTDMMPKGGS